MKTPIDIRAKQRPSRQSSELADPLGVVEPVAVGMPDIHSRARQRDAAAAASSTPPIGCHSFILEWPDLVWYLAGNFVPSVSLQPSRPLPWSTAREK